MDKQRIQQWQGELDRRDARITELEQWQAEAVALLEGGDHCYNGGIPLGDWYRRYDKLLEQVK